MKIRDVTHDPYHEYCRSVMLRKRLAIFKRRCQQHIHKVWHIILVSIMLEQPSFGLLPMLLHFEDPLGQRHCQFYQFLELCVDSLQF